MKELTPWWELSRQDSIMYCANLYSTKLHTNYAGDDEDLQSEFIIRLIIMLDEILAQGMQTKG